MESKYLVFHIHTITVKFMVNEFTVKLLYGIAAWTFPAKGGELRKEASSSIFEGPKRQIQANLNDWMEE